MSDLQQRLLDAAIRYAELGYFVFPCAPGGKVPLTEHGFKDATTDADQIDAWWRQHPNANVGIATAGLVVIDVDGAANPWLADAPDKLVELGGGPLSLTPGGGRHHVFRQTHGKAWRSTSGRIAPKVDTRGLGGYIVVPPSVVGGKPYRWAEGCELDCEPDALPEPPAWLVDLLDQAAGPDRPDPPRPDTPPCAPCSPQCVDPAAGGNKIPEGLRNATLAQLAGNMRRVGMGCNEIRAALAQTNADRCCPSLPASEVDKIAASISRYEPDQVSVALVENHWAQDAESARPPFVTAHELCRQHRELRKPVIHGLLREGETMNVIAAPKTGKSWLVLNLGLSVVTGMPWLDFPTEPGRVLLIDNELHAETLANRIPRVVDAMHLPESTWKDGLHVQPLRGCIEDLFRMETYFKALPAGFFKLIILDAFYRFMPRGMDENDNGTMAGLYNVIDRCAATLAAGFVLVHHTTKGLQSGKSVTDVGAGAGSQSRAADCHFILRPHEEDGCLSVDAVSRSWPPAKPFVIRQSFPLWTPDRSLDPRDLKRHYQKPRKRTDDEDEDEPRKLRWTPRKFVERFIGPEPMTKAAVFVAANEEGLTDYAAGKLLRKAEALDLLYRWQLGGNQPGFSTVPQEGSDDAPKGSE